MFQSLEMKHPKFYQVFRFFVVIAASIFYAWNLRCFAKTAGLFPGGFSGLSLLLQEIGLAFFGISIPYTLLNVLLNLFPTYIAYKYIGKRFTLYSIVVIVLSSIFVDILPPYMFTDDILLLSVFGGGVDQRAFLYALLICGGVGVLLSLIRADNARLQTREIEDLGLTLDFNMAVMRGVAMTDAERRFVEYVVQMVNNIFNIVNRCGVQMLIFLSGLQSISPAIYESCSIDGASGWETFWKITLPMVSPMILVNTVYTIIDAFTSSDNKVMKYISTVYEQANGNVLSSAMSWMYFLIVILIIAAVAGILSAFIFYQRRD